MVGQRRSAGRAAAAARVLALAVCIVATGCGAPAPTMAGPAARFVARLQGSTLDLVSGIHGTYALTADDVYPVWGALAIDGADAHMVTAMEGPLGIEAWEQVVRDGTVSERVGEGVWPSPAPEAEGSKSLRSALAAITSMDMVGDEIIDGATLRHLRTMESGLETDMFGIAGGGRAAATLDVWVDEEGVPARVHVEAGPLSLDLEDILIGEAAPIQAPGGVERLASSALHYTFLLPASGEVSERGGSGHLIGLDGAFVITYCASGSMHLDNWVTEGTTLYSGLWGAKPEAVERLMVRTTAGSAPAVLTSWHGSTEGQPAFILDLAVVAGGIACDVQWFSPPGDEAADRARFEQLLAGFRLGD